MTYITLHQLTKTNNEAIILRDIAIHTLRHNSVFTWLVINEYRCLTITTVLIDNYIGKIR